MLKLSTLVPGSLLLAGLALSVPAPNADARASAVQDAHGPNSHLLVNPRGAKPVSSGVAPGIRWTMPPRGFREKPPGFDRSLPHHAPSTVQRKDGTTPLPGGPGHDLGLFRGHDFAHFTAEERLLWERGFWRRAYHRGQRGWWWVVGDMWFFYPAPIYPSPRYIGTLDYYDYYEMYGTPEYYWYFCSDPEGYYPYIQECRRGWHAVPPVLQ